MKISNNALFNVKPYEENGQGGRVYTGTVLKTEAVQLPGNNSYYKLTILCHYKLNKVSFKLNREEMKSYYQFLCVGIGIKILTQKINNKWTVVKVKEINKIEDRVICLDQLLFWDEV